MLLPVLGLGKLVAVVVVLLDWSKGKEVGMVDMLAEEVVAEVDILVEVAGLVVLDML